MQSLNTKILTIILFITTSVITLTSLPVSAKDKQEVSPKQLLIINVKIFDGKSQKLKEGSVLIEGNLIKAIGAEVKTTGDVTTIDGGGRTLMPGLIDAHWHAMMSTISLNVAMTADIGYINHLAAVAASETLDRGFTTVRDMGGPSFGLKKAIDEKVIEGPRIFPSGGSISQTSGHGDFRPATAVPENPGTPLSYMERLGFYSIADGVPAVLKRTRETLRQGASQIKVMAGGGVASDFDPLDVTQYTFEELKAAVDAAGAWNTYVTVHAYTPEAMQMAIKAGVKSIEHGNLMDEKTAKLIAKKGVWLCLQPFLDDEDAIPFPDGSASRKKWLLMTKGTEKTYALAKKYKIKTAWGTDTLFSAALATRQGAQLAKLSRWYEPWQVLKMATHDNAELLALSGPRSPYPHKLGVIENNAYADLILVNGNPLKDINLIANPDKNFAMIIKDGVIYKNTLNSLEK